MLVFFWNFLQMPDTSKGDKTKRTVQAIPENIPVGFNLRVKCSSFRENSTKKIVKCRFGSVLMPFAMPEDATLGRLKERLADWMNQRGQGPDWTIEGRDREQIDFEFTYEVIPLIREVPMKIYLRQWELIVLPSQSWIDLSDQLVKKIGLPKGTLFRIYPVVGTVDNQDAEDHSYSIDWEAEKQYWFDIIYDISKDRNGRAKEVLMVDFSGRTDPFVVPQAATAQQVADLWIRLLDVLDDIGLQVTSGNGHEHFGGYVTTKATVPFVFRTSNMRSDPSIFTGSLTFEADQIGRLFDIKVPPFPKCQIAPHHRDGSVIRYDDDLVPLGLKILKTHLLSWNLEGAILKAPQVTTWWIPYDFGAIMRYGHSVNSAIPEDVNEAEFPPTPWDDEVTIRIKSQRPPRAPPVQQSVGGAPLPPPVPGPSKWRGPALGQAAPISTDAAGLADYTYG
jgi:hypothetical protein